jgi:uncharacterized membrane protein
MTTIKILRLLHLAAYVILSSQLMYYVFVMGDALKLISIESFMEQRKVVDPLVQQRHIPVYYAGLILTLALLILQFKQWNSFGYVSLAIAGLLLLADVFLSLTYNVPLNKLINNPGNVRNVNWDNVRMEWIYFIKMRALVSMVGLAVLLAGMLSFKK